MIRWLLALLILINLGIFAWGLQRELGRPEPTPEPQSDVPSLALLREQQGVAEESRSPSGSGGAPEPPPAIVEQSADRQENEGEGQGQTSKRGAEGAVASVSPVESVGSIALEDVARKARGVRQPPPVEDPAESASSESTEDQDLLPVPVEIDADEPSIFVSDEPPPGEASTVADEGSEPTAEQKLVTRCYAIGPFAKRADSEKALDILTESLGAMEIRQEATEKQIGYWVLIPKQENRSQALAKVAELKAAGFSDVWRFTRGRLANAISLGLFERQSQAERHREQVVAKGFPADVQPRYVEQATYWLDVDGAGRVVEDETWLHVTELYPEVQTSQVACP